LRQIRASRHVGQSASWRHHARIPCGVSGMFRHHLSRAQGTSLYRHHPPPGAGTASTIPPTDSGLSSRTASPCDTSTHAVHSSAVTSNVAAARYRRTPTAPHVWQWSGGSGRSRPCSRSAAASVPCLLPLRFECRRAAARLPLRSERYALAVPPCRGRRP
jgi:hypothetical protein